MYTLRAALSIAATLAVCLPGTSYAEDVSYPPGAYIVDMGNAANNATTARGLLGYGFVYNAVRNLQVPVDWIIKPGKQSQGEVDFVGPNGKSYVSSAFIVSADYASLVAANVDTYRALGAIIDGPTTTAFTAPRYANIRSVPNILLDTQTGPVVEDYLNNGNLTAASNIYRFGLPTALSQCEDVFALPHADPTWANHGNLATFNTQFKGFIWGACHAVSVLENLDSPSDADLDPNLNFLAAANSTSHLALVDFGDHSDGATPFTTVQTQWSNPFMQFVGDLGAATLNGSEQIYLPAPGTNWRPTTTVAITASAPADIPSESAGPAAKLVWGRGFGGADNGMVMYLAGHDHDKATSAAYVAAQRTFFNFLLQAGVEKSISPGVNLSVGATACSGSKVTLTASASGGTDTFTYQWSSTCGGSFSTATGGTTDFTIPTLPNGSQCFVKVVVRDGCSRFAFQTIPITIGDPKADLSVSVSASPSGAYAGDVGTFTVVASNAGPEVVTNATVTLALPASLTFLDASPSGQYDPATRRWSLGIMAPGATRTLIVRATIGLAPLDSTISVGASIAASDSEACTGLLSDPNPNNNNGSGGITFLGAGFYVADDVVEVAEATASPILASTLLGNDSEIDEGTFALVAGSTTQGGTVSYNAQTGVVSYTSAPGVVADTFYYEVCNVADAGECEQATVVVNVNQRPDLVGPTIFQAVGQPSASYVLASGYSDDEAHALGVVTPGAVVGGSASVVGGALVFRPNDAAVAASYAVPFTVCDAGTPPACRGVSATFIYNDPPLLTTASVDVVAGRTKAVDFATFFVSTGVIAGDDPGDSEAGDDALHSTRVAASVAGPFGDSASVDGTTCSVGGQDNSPVTVVAGTTIASVACAIEVCEEMPAAAAGVCAVTTLTVNVRECLIDADCGAGEVCVAFACVPCRDTAPLAGQDQGCTAIDPICDDRVAGAESCEECIDTTPGGLDLGCGAALPACDELAPGGHDCVECTENADCNVGEACQLTTHTCITCVDDATWPSLDSGCLATAPLCVEQGAISGGGGGTIHNCVVCEARAVIAGGPDQGCTSATPVCDENVPGGRCVECNGDNDCALGEVCDGDIGACVVCQDDRLAGTIDTGCDTDAPVCALGVTGPGDDHCVACEDDKGPGLTDWGCDASARFCALAGGVPVCLGCEGDVDCSDESVCIDGACVDLGATEANDDSYTTELGVTLTVGTVGAGLAGNDEIPAGSAFEVSLDGAGPSAAEGTLTLRGDGTFTFVPASGFAGSVVFAYTLAAEVSGKSDGATVTIVVNGPPRPADDVITSDEDTAVSFDPRTNDVDPNGGELTLTRIVTGPSHGAAVSLAGTLTYTPVAEYSGPDQLVYEVCDSTLRCASATVRITVTPINDRPAARDDLVTTPEDTPVLVIVLANDEDIDSPTLEVRRILGAPTHGVAAIQTDDTILYQPAVDFAGDDTVVYEACDADGQCDEAVVLVRVTPVNDAPFAGDDRTTTPGVTPVTLAVLDNDSDVDGDALRVARIVYAPASGSARIEASGAITYTPIAETSGVVTFTYEVCDPALACDLADVKVTVGVDNAPPVVVDDRVSTALDAPVTVSVLANDSDPDGDPLSLLQVGRPATGSVVMNGDGTLTYTPGAGFGGSVTFSYTACDDQGACASADVIVTVVAGDNRPPVATDDLVTTRVDVAVDIEPVLNDVDPDGDALSVDAITEPPGSGIATLANGIVRYTPAAGWTGRDAFEVSIADGRGGFDRSVVTVVVALEANTPPVASDDRFDVPADEASQLAVLANDSDANGDVLTIVEVGQPSSGLVTVTVSGGVARLTFTPSTDPATAPASLRSGRDTFSYSVSDGRGGQDAATVTLVFPGGSAGPSAIGEAVHTPEDTAVLIVVLANDSDPSGGLLTVTALASPPHHGDATIGAGGAVLYVPAADYVGSDTFSYRVCDEDGACAEAVVAVEVTPVNDGPRANDDSYARPIGETSALDVVANDSDPELDLLVVTRIVTAPARGQALVGVDGEVDYQAPDSAGSETFVYEVCDEAGLCDEAVVTVVVGGDNHEPLAEDDEATTDAGEAIAIDVLDNDSDPDGDALSVMIVEDPAHGATEVVAGAVEYTPDRDFNGNDSFFYVVCDPANACATAVVVVTVVPGGNRAPVAVDDTVHTPEDTAVVFDATGNDIDFDGDPLSVSAVGLATHGGVARNGDGTITYTPDPGYVGSDVFSVTIDDGRGGSATSTALVIVTPAGNRAPDAVDDAFDAAAGVPTNLAVLANDDDPDGDALSIVAVVQPAHGLVTIDDGALVLTATAGYVGVDRLGYTISDGRGGYDSAVVELVIGDRDHDGLGDAHEVDVSHTDPDDFDSDDDGLGDGEELAPGIGTDPLDADSDDDGLADGTEVHGDGPLSAPTDPLAPDSDGDGVADGVEAGVTEPIAGGTSDGGAQTFVGTDVDTWIPDADPSSTTNPLDDDSDDDGLTDGFEDINGNGAHDGDIGATGSVGSGETDATNDDSDGDGIQDGTELGLTEPQGDDTDPARFQPDLDPATTTDPRDRDSDDGGNLDGEEDLDHNGRVDPGERDPSSDGDDAKDKSDASDDGCGGGTSTLSIGLAGLVLVLARRRREVVSAPLSRR